MTTKISKRELKNLRKRAPLTTRKAVRMSRLPKKAKVAGEQRH